MSTEVVTAIADRKNVDPVELPPLYPEVDLDALDRLFHPAGTRTVPAVDRVTFEVLGCEVVVEGPQQVAVQSARADRKARLVE